MVTGGAQGIGRAIVEACLTNGWNVALLDPDIAAIEALEEELGLPDGLMSHDGSNHDERVVRNAIEETVERYGALFGLVNNAGFSRNMPLEQLSLEDWNAVIATNLTVGFLCARHAAPHLRKAMGAIVNLASTRAFMSEPDTEAYCASKGGDFGLTHALAASLAPDVRVNAISPGWIATEAWQKPSVRSEPDLNASDHAQHWSGRVGNPEDIASMAVYLLSDEAGFVTGANMVIDGGMTRKMIYQH
ncbi:MAG: SDR family oxidoreductase [Alphaproteobacteria bacterium]|nr:SDR family oxidoreductase [Alphaproteobacteria bacterium]